MKYPDFVYFILYRIFGIVNCKKCGQAAPVLCGFTLCRDGLSGTRIGDADADVCGVLQFRGGPEGERGH